MTEKIDIQKREEEDKRLIMAAYRNLLRTLDGKMDESDKKNIREAYELAVDAHKAQRRKSGEPYITHPIEVARICLEEIGLGNRMATLVAGRVKAILEKNQDLRPAFVCLDTYSAAARQQLPTEFLPVAWALPVCTH